MNPPAVLHVLAALGGGVDRYVRDIAAAVPRAHLLWHVGERAEALETPEEPRFHPLDPALVDGSAETLARWLGLRGVGVAHLHSVSRATRRRAELASTRLDIPLVVTLHDVQFMRPDAFRYADPQAEPSWTAELDPLLRAAKAVLAPSDYIAQRARSAFPGLEVSVVPNGIALGPGAPDGPAARPAFLERAKPAHVVAVLGAIGPHKGAELLRALPPHLEGSGIAIVVVGYLDKQLFPGWNEETGAFVHGPYDPRHTGALLRAYGAELVLFPNLAPESFSYTLSEAWAAGYPVLASPRGAIGERVRAHGGGWLLPEGFGPAEVARELRRLCSREAAEELARVKSALANPDADRVPTLSAMAETIESYYRRYGSQREAASGADPQALQQLLATSLDSSLFRQELAHLADLCDDAGQSSTRLRKFEAEARAWIAHLEGDVAALKADCQRLLAERDRLVQELGGIRAAGALASRLPPSVRRLIAKLVRRGGS